MKKITNSFSFLFIYLLLGLPIAIFIRLFRPVRVIRFGRLFSSRIGHFAANTELYLCERDEGLHTKSIDFFYLDGFVCNKALADMWRRCLNLYPRWLMLPIVHASRSLPFSDIHKAPEPYQYDRDVLGLYAKHPPHLGFDTNQEKRGREFLRECGLEIGDKFVCVTIRDSSYLKSVMPDQDFSYHDYRDSSVDSYIPAITYLLDQGYFVYRMGAVVERKVEISHPNFIDYASNGMRSEFLDIYLAANCTFCLTSGTGFDALPVIFRKPLLQVNAVPLCYAYSFVKGSLLMAKHHFDRETNKELSISEIMARGAGTFMNSQCFDDAGILLKENSPDEILLATIQMTNIIKLQVDDENSYDQELWKVGINNAVEAVNGKPLHGKIVAHFARTYADRQLMLLKKT